MVAKAAWGGIQWCADSAICVKMQACRRCGLICDRCRRITGVTHKEPLFFILECRVISRFQARDINTFTKRSCCFLSISIKGTDADGRGRTRTLTAAAAQTRGDRMMYPFHSGAFCLSVPRRRHSCRRHVRGIEQGRLRIGGGRTLIN